MPATDLVREIVTAPRESALLLDFDGTLSPIVLNPASARPLPGAGSILRELASSLAVVGVISGRPLRFLETFFDPSIRLAGLYGLERCVAGVHWEHPESERWRAVVSQVALAAERAVPAGVFVENKGVSITVHFRDRPACGPAVMTLAAELSAAAGLQIRPAKQSVELHPPSSTDKGSVVLDWAGDVHSANAGPVVYFGDDHGDLPAFRALRQLREFGRSAFSVAVAGQETPAELVAESDLVVAGPAGVLGQLSALAAALAAAS